MSTTKLARFLSYATAVILVLIPFQAFLTTWAGSNFGHIDAFRIWKELILAVLTLGTLLLAYRQPKLKKWLVNSPLTTLVLVYVLLQLGMGIFALQTERVNASALVYALMINLRYLLFFMICLILASSSEWLRQHWKKIILVPAVIVIAFGLLQHFVLADNFLTHFGYGPKTIPAYQAVDLKPEYIRTQSTLRGANPLGAYLLVVLTLAWGFWLCKRHRTQAMVFGWTGLIVLYFTYSRSAWIGFFLSVVALAFWLIKSKRQRQKFALASLIAIIALAGAVAIWQKNGVLQNTLFHTSQTSKSEESSNAVRTQAMLDGAESVIEQPLGNGPGTAGPASFRNPYQVRVSENYFIQIGQEVGVIGLGIFIAINIYVAKLLWRSKDWLAMTLLAILAGLTVVNLLSHAWADDTLAYIYWGLTGIALAPSVIHKSRTSQPAQRQNR